MVASNHEAILVCRADKYAGPMSGESVPLDWAIFLPHDEVVVYLGAEYDGPRGLFMIKILHGEQIYWTDFENLDELDEDREKR